MAGVVAKVAAKKLLASEFKKYKNKKPAGEYDPLFELRPNHRGKMVKQKKLIPDYLPEKEATILADVRKRAYKLDMALFEFMGIRFGWSSAIGLIPEIGDVIDMLMALGVYRKCAKCNLPGGVKMQMLMWIFIDFVIGLVPLVGDLLDASLKANTKNVRLLEEELDRQFKPKEVRAEERRRSRLDDNYRPPAPATVYEELSEDELPPDYRTRDHTPEPLRIQEPRRPDASRSKEERHGGHAPERKKSKKSSWFSTPNREPDLEAGDRRPKRSDSRRH